MLTKNTFRVMKMQHKLFFILIFLPSLLLTKAAYASLHVGTVGQKTISISWDAVSGATGYSIDVNGSNVGSTSGTSYTITGLYGGNTYSITVNYFGTSSGSVGSATQTTNGPYETPPGNTGGGNTGGGSGTTDGLTPWATINVESTHFCAGGTSNFYVTTNVPGCTVSSWSATLSSFPFTSGITPNGSMAANIAWPNDAGGKAATVSATMVGAACVTPQAYGPFSILNKTTPAVNFSLVDLTSGSHLCQGVDNSLKLSVSSNYAYSIEGFNFSIDHGVGIVHSGGPSDVVYTYSTKNLSPGTYNASVTMLTYGEGCAPQTVVSSSSSFTIIPTPQVNSFLNSDPSEAICSGMSVNFTPTADVPGSSVNWQTTTSGAISGASSSGSGKITDILMNSSQLPGTVSYNLTPDFNGCDGTTMPFVVTVNPIANTPPNQNLTYCAWDDITLDPNSPYSMTWSDNNNQSLGTGHQFHLGQLPVGSYSYSGIAFSDWGCATASPTSFNITVTDDCDDRLNWIETTSFDETTIPYSHTKNYYGYNGEPIQSQSVNHSAAKVFGSQGMRDQLDRVVGITLPAPTPYSVFRYDYNFLLNQSKKRYAPSDFDGPTTMTHPIPVDQSTPGTIGWYYGTENSIETNVPITGYPYTRTELYKDGSSEVKKNASQGDKHRLGAGHEIVSRVFPVSTELTDYLTFRRDQIHLTDNITSLCKNATQSVVGDENKRYSITISDKAGNVVMTARPAANANEADLLVNNHLIAKVDNTQETIDNVVTTLSNEEWAYFYLLIPTPVTLTTAGSFVVEELISEATMTQAFTGPDGNWPVGFYRVKSTDAFNNVDIKFTSYYKEVSYRFYNDAGRLVSSISPNGFKQFKNGTSYDNIDKTTYQYNHQGWLLSIQEPDAGITNYLYRRDGKIRFSQNAEQALHHYFSYTNYDAIGRPVESGEYRGEESNNLFQFANLAQYVESYGSYNMTDASKKDWIKSYYNTESSFNSIPGFSSIRTNTNTPYTQNFTRGAVASTQNINTQTWYSYDELGRVTWMLQKPKDLPRSFIITYNYDFLGNVKDVGNFAYDLNGNLRDQFYHHYEYDADKRLQRAYTSITPGESDRKLRVTYEYYLHGPLKRIVLGDKLQGLDFVYNINGWLRQINHPDKMQDPGKDGQGNGVREDVFGMILDYYESDLQNLYLADNNSIHDSQKRHHLPFSMQNIASNVHIPLPRFESPFDQQSMDPAIQVKEYSAQNTRYKKLITESKQQLAEGAISEDNQVTKK